MFDVLQLGFLTLICAAIWREDIRNFRIPDATNALLVAGGLAVRTPEGWYALCIGVFNAVIVFACVFAVTNALSRVRGRRGLGTGDIKLMAASAIWLDLSDIPSFLLVACASALVFVAVTYKSVEGSVTNRRIPFGPFLCLGLVSTWATEHFQSLNFG